MNTGFSSEMLGAIAGVLISWLFSYTPGLKEWFDKQTSAQKGAIMVGAMLLVSAAVYGLSCANSPFDLGVSCDEAGVWKLAAILFYAIVGNQATYLLSPQKKAAVVIEAQPAGESPFIDFPVPVDDVQPEPDRLPDDVTQEIVSEINKGMTETMQEHARKAAQSERDAAGVILTNAYDNDETLTAAYLKMVQDGR